MKQTYHNVYAAEFPLSL